MSDLVLYDENRQSLTPISFIKDVSSQVRIRDVSSYEFTKRLGMIMTEISFSVGIKNEISDYDKRDIKDCILNKYMNLSLDEIAYAFKLERYGELHERTEHYQEFNVIYISKVLDNYKIWKQGIKKTHSIKNTIAIEEQSEETKREANRSSIQKVLDHFTMNSTLKSGYLFTYDLLYDRGFLETDISAKKEIYNSAQQVLENEYLLKKAKSLTEKREIKGIIERIKQPKDTLVVLKSKEISILRFLRKLRTDSELMGKLVNEFGLKNK